VSVVYYDLCNVCTLRYAVSRLAESDGISDPEWTDAINPFPEDRDIIYVIINVNASSSNSYVGIAGNLNNRFKSRCEAAVHLGLTSSYMENIHVWWGKVRVFNTPATLSISSNSVSSHSSALIPVPAIPVESKKAVSTRHSVRLAAPASGAPVTARTAAPRTHASTTTASLSSSPIRHAAVTIASQSSHTVSSASSFGATLHTPAPGPVSFHTRPIGLDWADFGPPSTVKFGRTMSASIDTRSVNLEKLLIRYYLNLNIVNANTNSIYAKTPIHNQSSSPMKIYVNYCASGTLPAGTGWHRIEGHGSL
jgi:hypothetical protein